MFKRITIMAVLLAFTSLAIPSDTFAKHRNGRYGYRAGYGRTYYTSPYRYQRRAYYVNPYRYQRLSYYNTNPYRYQTRAYYSPYAYRGVASNRYYAGNRYNGGNRYFGSRRNSTRDLILRIAAPAAVGAGVGALLGGKKGAAVGALFGGGGGAIYHLIRQRNRRY